MKQIPALVAALLLLPAGCGGSSEPSEPCTLPAQVDDLSLLPGDLPLDRWGAVDQIEVNDGFLSARAKTTTSIVELYPVMARATSEAGYTILSGDNEGFEAEIFFERGPGTTGTYRLREGPCADQITIRLLYGAERYRRMS